MEYILQNTLLALLEYPGSTLLDVNRMLTNKVFRKAVIEKVTDPIVRSFWTEEFATYTDRYTQEATPAIQNKVGQFVSNPLVRNIVGQSKSSFNLREMMDQRKIFIVNLSKGRMGESNAALLGSMLTVKIYLAAMSRADEPASRMAKLPRVYFYVDEFQSMMNEAFADILSESRKYKLALTLANQYIEQMEEEVRDAVFGNVGTMICFRVGPFDAEVLKTVFEPTFTAEDLVLLGVGQVYLTLMIDGVGSAPFSAQTIPPIETPSISYKDDVITNSRAAYGRSRADIENTIREWQQEFAAPAAEKKSDRPFDKGGGFDRGQRLQRPGDRPDRPREDRPREDRFRDERRDDRPRNDRPREERRDDRPRDDRPRDERPREDRRDDRPRPQFTEERPREEHAQMPSAAPARPRDDAHDRPIHSPDVVPPKTDAGRDALKAAISTVQVTRETRSPIEILREKFAKKEKVETPTPQASSQSRSQPESESQQRPVPPPQKPSPQEETGTVHTGEASLEDVRRVLYGQDK